MKHFKKKNLSIKFSEKSVKQVNLTGLPRVSCTRACLKLIIQRFGLA